MTRLMNRFVTIAAVLTLTGTAAVAQNLRGEVPFAFTASGKSMPAGNYDVTRLRGNITGWTLRHVDSNRQAVVISNSAAKERSRSERVKSGLVFQCVENAGCALQSLFSGGSTSGYAFPVRMTVTDPDIRIALVRVVFGD
jgi:hypothetical protein